jgi:hypothetical protein
MFDCSTYAKNYWSEQERLTILPVMHENILNNMKSLIAYARAHNKKFEPAHSDMADAVSELRAEEVTGVPITVIRQVLSVLLHSEGVEIVLQYHGTDLGPVWDKIATLVCVLFPSVCRRIRWRSFLSLSVQWTAPAIVSAYGHRSELNLTDSAKYFFDRIREVTHDEYIPSPNDILRVLQRTEGLVEGEFEMDPINTFHVYDLGGTVCGAGAGGRWVIG